MCHGRRQTAQLVASSESRWAVQHWVLVNPVLSLAFLHCKHVLFMEFSTSPALSYPTTQTWCAENYCMWKPGGVPAPPPPQVLVETTLANLACMVSRLITKQSMLLKTQRRTSPNQDLKARLDKCLPVEAAQYKEVIGGSTAQPVFVSLCLGYIHKRQFVLFYCH